MVLAIVVVVAVVALVARGRGGGLSAERADYVPLDLGPVTATDVVLLRPPSGLWGYNVQATDEALEHIAESIRERDVRIVALEQLVTDLSRDQAPALPLASPYPAPRHRRPVGYGLTDSLRARGYDSAAWEASADETPPVPEPPTGAYRPQRAYEPEAPDRPGPARQPAATGYDPSWFEARSTGPLPAADPERYPAAARPDEAPSPAEPPLFDPAPWEAPPEAAPVYEAPADEASGYETPADEAPGYEAPGYEASGYEAGPPEPEPPEQSHD